VLVEHLLQWQERERGGRAGVILGPLASAAWPKPSWSGKFTALPTYARVAYAPATQCNHVFAALENLARHCDTILDSSDYILRSFAVTSAMPTGSRHQQHRHTDGGFLRRPVITQQLRTNCLARADGNVHCDRDGTAPLSYQWQKGTTPISGATATSYNNASNYIV